MDAHLRVPVAVVEDDRVGGLQVDAEPPRTGGHDEAEEAGVGAIEHVDVHLALHAVSAPVEAAVPKVKNIAHRTGRDNSDGAGRRGVGGVGGAEKEQRKRGEKAEGWGGHGVYNGVFNIQLDRVSQHSYSCTTLHIAYMSTVPQCTAMLQQCYRAMYAQHTHACTT